MTDICQHAYRHEELLSRESRYRSFYLQQFEERKADLPDGVSVIKSGVVDGMAYTLYSDGSIEAQLPGEGPIRFASLDALRTYVEQRQ